MKAEFKKTDTSFLGRLINLFHKSRQEPDIYPVKYYKKGKYVKVEAVEE